VTLYHQYSSLLTSIGAIRCQDIAAELKKVEEEEDKSMDVKALLLQELHSLSSYRHQSVDRESRDCILKKIKLFIEQNHVTQQNNLVQLEDYEGLKNFRELVFDLKAAVEVISMDGSHEQYCDAEVMKVCLFTVNMSLV
jgi:hypothetical protein